MDKTQLIFRFIIDCIAVFRLTRIITRDRISEDVRNAVGERLGRDSMVTYLINCDWCISIWAALIIFSLRKTSPNVSDWLSGLLAASAITGIASDNGV